MMCRLPWARKKFHCFFDLGPEHQIGMVCPISLLYSAVPFSADDFLQNSHKS